MKFYSGSHFLQALFALPVFFGAIVVALVVWAWQIWRQRGLHRAGSLDGMVCLAGGDNEAAIWSALLPSLVWALLMGAFLGSLFNSAFSRWSPNYPFYYACTTAAYYPRCTGPIPPELIRYADISSVMLLAGAVLGVGPILSQPKVRVTAWPGMVVRRRWFRGQRFEPEECSFIELVPETKVYYGAGHLVDLEKNVDRKVDVQLVLKDRTRVWVGRVSGRGSEQHAAAAARALADAIGVPVRAET